MKRFIKYFLCLLISLCVFAGTGCGLMSFAAGVEQQPMRL